MKASITILALAFGLSACGQQVRIESSRFEVNGSPQAVQDFVAKQARTGSLNVTMTPEAGTVRATFRRLSRKDVTRLAKEASGAHLGWRIEQRSRRVSFGL